MSVAPCAETMAPHGLKRAREEGAADGGRVLCPFQGCHFSANTSRAVSIHISMVEHTTRLRAKSASESSDSEGSASEHLSQSSPSSSNSSDVHSSGSARESASNGPSDSGNGGFSAAEGAEELLDQGSMHDQSPDLNDACDEGHAHSAACDHANAMNVDLCDAVAYEPDPDPDSSSSSSDGSSSDSDQHAGSDADADGLQHAAGNGQAGTLTEEEVRLHDVLNGLSLQKQQQIIDYLQDPALDRAQVRFRTARGLRKAVKATCKQVRMAAIMNASLAGSTCAAAAQSTMQAD